MAPLKLLFLAALCSLAVAGGGECLLCSAAAAAAALLLLAHEAMSAQQGCSAGASKGRAWLFLEAAVRQCGTRVTCPPSFSVHRG